MNIIFKILFFLIAIEVVAVIFFVYRKRRHVKNDITISLARFPKLTVLIKKHWIITTCIILFALIYPTILFVYIKFIIGFFITKCWPHLLAFLPALWLWKLGRNDKISSKNIFIISGIYLILSLLMHLYTVTSKHYVMTSLIGLFLVLFCFYLISALMMTLLKKEKFRWTLFFIIGNIVIFLGSSIFEFGYRGMSFFNLTNIRSESECLKLKKQDACQKYYDWRYGVCMWGDSYCAEGPVISGPLEG